MVTLYQTMRIKNKVVALLDDCEYIYRKYHPELNEVYLSKSKVLYEVIKFYLQKTEKKINE